MLLHLHPGGPFHVTVHVQRVILQQEHVFGAASVGHDLGLYGARVGGVLEIVHHGTGQHFRDFGRLAFGPPCRRSGLPCPCGAGCRSGSSFIGPPMGLVHRAGVRMPVVLPADSAAYRPVGTSAMHPARTCPNVDTWASFLALTGVAQAPWRENSPAPLFWLIAVFRISMLYVPHGTHICLCQGKYVSRKKTLLRIIQAPASTRFAARPTVVYRTFTFHACPDGICNTCAMLTKY